MNQDIQISSNSVPSKTPTERWYTGKMTAAELKAARSFLDDYETVCFVKDKTQESQNLLVFQVISGLVVAGYGNYAFMTEERMVKAQERIVQLEDVIFSHHDQRHNDKVNATKNNSKATVNLPLSNATQNEPPAQNQCNDIHSENFNSINSSFGQAQGQSLQQMDAAQGTIVDTVKEKSKNFMIEIRTDGKDYTQRTVVQPYFSRLADKHQKVHLDFAAAREQKKSLKRSYLEACATYEFAKQALNNCYDEDSDDDLSFVSVKEMRPNQNSNK